MVHISAEISKLNPGSERMTPELAKMAELLMVFVYRASEHSYGTLSLVVVINMSLVTVDQKRFQKPEIALFQKLNYSSVICTPESPDFIGRIC